MYFYTKYQHQLYSSRVTLKIGSSHIRLEFSQTIDSVISLQNKICIFSFALAVFDLFRERSRWSEHVQIDPDLQPKEMEAKLLLLLL